MQGHPSTASNQKAASAKSANGGASQPPKAKAKYDWQLIKRFIHFLKPYRRGVILGSAMIPFSVMFSVLYPWLIMRIIDEQLVPGDYDGLVQGVVILIGVMFANYISDAIYNFSLQKAAQQAIRDMRTVMFDRVMHFPRSYFDTTPMGVTLTRLTTDLEAINESFAQGLLNMIRDLMITIALLIFLAVISWRLALVLLLLGPVVYYITEKLRKLMRKAFSEGRQVLSQGTGFLQECLNGIKTVQLYGAEETSQKYYAGFTKAFFKTQSRSNLYDSALFSLIEGVTTVSMGLIIWYGAGEVLAATISVGVLIGFINTLDKIFVPVRDFTSQLASIQRALAALQHVDMVFSQNLEEDLSRKTIAGLERFESVVFDDV
ncbi:MAG: ABC transporter ATP-binding protein [Gammaproteobacteria bacterium]|nr:ABC transporter ATP-binding protein [Gammaproteobacteria bacterium]MBT6420821.1 ABC transporter ATP-binding protein [Gammaproteobacteria bacterium]